MQIGKYRATGREPQLSNAISGISTNSGSLASASIEKEKGEIESKKAIIDQVVQMLTKLLTQIDSQSNNAATAQKDSTEALKSAVQNVQS